jgi:hypothetical protein
MTTPNASADTSPAASTDVLAGARPEVAPDA